MNNGNKNDQDTEHVSTEHFARRNMVKPQSVRARLCRFGSYFGIRPLKLKNGRLGWPDVQVEVL